MKHGETLRKYIQERGLRFSAVNERLGHSSPNTLTQWMKQDTLRPEQFSKLLEQFPDILDFFPDINVGIITSMAKEPQESYGYKTKEERECAEQLTFYKKQYYQALERFNHVQDRMIDLQTEHMELLRKFNNLPPRPARA
jgi:hypothetical protein